MDITEEEAKDRIVGAAIAYCDQLCAFNDIAHPEVQKWRTKLAEAVSFYINMTTQPQDDVKEDVGEGGELTR